jgi:putrescine transport system ATP-binding protein
MADPASIQGLRVQGLAVTLGSRTILRDVDFTVGHRSTLAVIGPSGSGKTSLLRALAGLGGVVAGCIEVEGRRVDRLPAHRRGIVYLNQEPLLFPHLDVRANLEFGLRLRSRDAGRVASVVDPLVGALGLQGLERRDPLTLSGGERQRVAFGRALAVEPAVLLLDEPFASLDPATRLAMQALFRQVARSRGITAIFVTHDLKECLRVGDQFAAIRGGGCRLYVDRAAFCADPANGVAAEVAFWSAAADAPRPE